MNSSTLRRLASDHVSLHKTKPPPHYLFPLGLVASMPHDLTQLTILLAGPQGTPYAQGLFKLLLKMPHDYPKSPPKAFFRTKIWHPNVEESTGSVCVDTLKRDWEAKLTLRDVLITISCLLIQPNPDSALNARAGQLLQEDYETFAHQAKLMTSIHATIPANLEVAVMEAKSRVEERSKLIEAKSKPQGKSSSLPSPAKVVRPGRLLKWNVVDLSESDDEEDEVAASKENDPSLSPSPVNPPSPRRSNILGKRPLCDLPTPLDTESEGEEKCSDMTISERNVANNTSYFPAQSLAAGTGTLQLKSPKLVEHSRSFNFVSRTKDPSSSQAATGLMITPSEVSSEDLAPATKRVCSREEKENVASISGEKKDVPTTMLQSATLASNVGQKVSSARNVSSASSSSAGSGKGRMRIGVRRL